MNTKGLFGIRKPFSRFAVALGGFLIVVGIIIVAFLMVIFLDTVEFSILEAENFESVALLILLAIGVVDLLAGFVLWRR